MTLCRRGFSPCLLSPWPMAARSNLSLRPFRPNSGPEPRPFRARTRRASVWMAAFVLALSTTACRKCGPSGEDTTAAAVEPPVPAPAGLLADVYVPSPNAFWSKLQRGIGGAVGILPPSAGGVVAMGLGLDPSVGEEIDGALPAYGVVAGEPQAPAWAVALKLTDPRHARGALFDGDTSRFQAKERGDLTEMVARGGGPASAYGLALSKSGYLIVARAPADLDTLAPYLTRTLPSRPAPSGAIVVDVSREALATRLAPKLAAYWESTKAGLLDQAERERERRGRAPDYGDPKAVVAVVDTMATRAFDVVKDLDRVRLSFDVDDGGAIIAATFTPAKEGGAASTWIDGMKTGDAAPLGKLPIASAVALLTRDGEKDRTEQAKRIEDSLSAVLASRLGEADLKKVRDVVEAATKARGDVLTASFLWDGPEGVVVRATGATEEGQRAIQGAIELARTAPVQETFRLRDVTTRTEEVPELGKVQFASFWPSLDEASAVRLAKFSGKAKPDTERAAAEAGLAPALSLAWVDQGGLLVAAAKDPTASIRAVVKPERTLGDEPVVQSMLAPLGSDASTIAVLQPLRFDPKRANLPTAPIVFAVGRHGKEAFARYHVSNGILRELSRVLMGM